MKFLRSRSRPGSVVVPAAAALLAIFAVLGGAAWAVTRGATKGPSVKSSITLTFSADDTSHDLFKVGGSTVFARCGPAEGPEAGGIRRTIGIRVGSQGAVVAGEDEFTEVPPNDEDVMLFDEVPPGGVNAAHFSVSVFDGGGTAASISAGLLADPPNNRCVVTAHAGG